MLIKKIEFIGFSEEITKWFKSYPSNTKFKVHIKNTFSEPGNLLRGVSQGSILGPLLFLLYLMICHKLLTVNYCYVLMTVA